MTTSSDLEPGFDPRIADWLEDDPDTAPAHVLATVLAAAPSIPQRQAQRLPWRSPAVNRFVVVMAAALLAVAAITALSVGSPPPAPSPVPSVRVLPSVTPSIDPNKAPLGGRILVEHFGNAPDGSESTGDGSPDKRRLYLVDPNDMSAAGYTEFLPGKPATGKTSADVSLDGSQVVFADWADPSRIYLAGIDGTGFRQLTPDGCACSEWDPAFDPTGTKVVYGHAEGDQAWLEIRDLATGETTRLARTAGSRDDDVPAAPSWSPDGRSIAFQRWTWGGLEPSMGQVHYGGDLPSRTLIQIIHLADDTLTVPGTQPYILGEPHWAPDGRSLLLTEHPMTLLGGSGGRYRVFIWSPDGGPTSMQPVGPDPESPIEVDGATWTPDGRILYTFDRFLLIRPDGSAGRFVDPTYSDNTDASVGFVYVGHWVGSP